MNIIEISITEKHAAVVGSPVIVCGNSDYSVKFTFDEEWTEHDAKTARFAYCRNGHGGYTDVEFSGDTAVVPVLADIREVWVGVFVGDIRATTPARIPCELSIRCGAGEQDSVEMGG